MPHRFQHRSLKAYLLRRFIPLIAVTTALITAWALFGNWFSVWTMGNMWVSSSTGRLHSEADEVAQEAALAKVLVTHILEHDQEMALPQGYSLFGLGKDRSVMLLSGRPATEDRSGKELLEFRKPGLYEWNGKLAYILPFKAPDAKKRMRDLILIRSLNNRFADRIAAIIGTEIEILMIKPSPRIAASTWRNKNGDRVYPGYEPAEWEGLARLGKGGTASGSKIYRVPDYRGLYSETMGDGAFDRGTSTIRAFQAFTPIEDENGERIGYFAVIVPMAVMLGSMRESMALSLLCGLVVALLGALLIVRTSRDVARPITALSERIRSLARVFYPQGPETAAPSQATGNEIEILAAGVDLLQKEMERADQVEHLIAEERERAQFASKMAALGEMSANVAHEINNPVAVIHALSDELKEKVAAGKIGPQDTDRIATEIKDTASRVAAIIRALLRLARDSEGDGIEWFSLKTIVEDAVVLAREQMQKNRIAFSVTGLEDDVRVRCRGAQVSQVLLNLLHNAIDAVETEGEKWIRIEVERGPNSVWLAVADGGPGVAGNVRERFMEPFVTTKPPGKGTGLGLSISKHIVTEHGGKMFLDEQSPYTKVVFGLPIDPHKVPRPRAVGAASLRSV